MSVVTTVDAWPDAGHPFTVADLDRLPDDGRRYELLDGGLVVSPRPTMAHQFAAFRLAALLDAACPEDLCVIPEPGMRLGPATEFAPDIVVIRLDQVRGAKLTEPPLLVVEVRSPATALIDLSRKKHAYEEFGVASYWILNPEPEKPELTVFELQDGQYSRVARATAAVTLSRPFSVTVDPASLTSKLRR